MSSLYQNCGVRVLKGGTWGFAAAPEITAASASALARQAVQIAEANAVLERRPVKTKVALLVEAAKAAKAAVPQVRAVTGFFRLAIEEKAFFSTRGDERARARTPRRRGGARGPGRTRRPDPGARAASSPQDPARAAS